MIVLDTNVLSETLRPRHRPISEADAQIAAITRSRRAALATRNVEDFVGCELQVIDPWN
jgi:predicted nucleic acid-binding protein